MLGKSDVLPSTQFYWQVEFLKLDAKPAQNLVLTEGCITNLFKKQRTKITAAKKAMKIFKKCYKSIIGVNALFLGNKLLLVDNNQIYAVIVAHSLVRLNCLIENCQT